MNDVYHNAVVEPLQAPIILFITANNTCTLAVRLYALIIEENATNEYIHCSGNTIQFNSCYIDISVNTTQQREPQNETYYYE